MCPCDKVAHLVLCGGLHFLTTYFKHLEVSVHLLGLVLAVELIPVPIVIPVLFSLCFGVTLLEHGGYLGFEGV